MMYNIIMNILCEVLNMYPIERQLAIFELVKTNDVLKLKDLTDKFNISIETLRRDLSVLEKQGKIQKIYGGIKLAETYSGEPLMQNRMGSKLNIKEKIGKKCSEFITEGDCIFLDSGSTTYHIAKNIKNIKNLIVITNSIPIINELIDTNIDVIVIGGKLRHNENSIVSYDYLFNFGNLNISKSFICAGGITLEKGVSDYNMEEAVTRRNILDISNQVFVAADSSKIGRNVPINICGIDVVNYLITDKNIDDSIECLFKKSSCELIIADN